VSQIKPLRTTPSQSETVEAADWLKANWVTAAAVLGLVLALWWRAGLLAHAFFRQNDFELLGHASASSFGPSYLLAPSNGRVAPAALAVIWVEARAALYNWPAAMAVSLLLLAAAGLALLRLLRTLFGSRPAILVPIGIYLVTPLLVPALSWWSASLAALPLQASIFMAANSHIRYITTGRFRHAVVATCWMAAGMLFSDKGVLVPLLLLALTSALLRHGPWHQSLLITLRRHWRAWLAYTGLMLAYVALLAADLAGSGFTPRPMSGGAAASFGWSLIRLGLVPGLVGGPWRWWSSGSYAVAVETAVLTQLSWICAALLVAASSWFRRRAWRAWAIFLGWVVLADVVPVIAGWRGAVVTPALAADLNYLADAVPVLVICGTFAFLPLAGEGAAYRARLPGQAVRVPLAINLVAAIVIGSLWSAHAYQDATTNSPARSFIATAKQALGQVPKGARIISTPLPAAVMNAAFFGDAAYTAKVLGPLVPGSARVRWTRSPSGTPKNVLIFDNQGRLWPAIAVGVQAVLPRAGCWRIPSRLTSLPLQHGLYKWPWTIQLGYSGPATSLLVGFAGSRHGVVLPAGHHQVLLPASGYGGAVTVQNYGPPGGCLTYLTVGTMQASVYGHPVPATPATG